MGPAAHTADGDSRRAVRRTRGCRRNLQCSGSARGATGAAMITARCTTPARWSELPRRSPPSPPVAPRCPRRPRRRILGRAANAGRTGALASVARSHRRCPAATACAIVISRWWRRCRWARSWATTARTAVSSRHSSTPGAQDHQWRVTGEAVGVLLGVGQPQQAVGARSTAVQHPRQFGVQGVQSPAVPARDGEKPSAARRGERDESTTDHPDSCVYLSVEPVPAARWRTA